MEPAPVKVLIAPWHGDPEVYTVTIDGQLVFRGFDPRDAHDLTILGKLVWAAATGQTVMVGRSRV